MTENTMQEILTGNPYFGESVDVLRSQFPALAEPEPEVEEEESGFSDPESEDSDKPKKRRLTQTERLKKKLLDAETEKMNYKRMAEEQALLRAHETQEKLAEKYNKNEVLEKSLEEEIEQSLLFKQSYDSEQDIENSLKTEKRIRSLDEELARVRNEKAILANTHHQNKNLIENASREYQNSTYSAVTDYDLDENSDAKRKNLDDFMKAHPFLDASNNNVNYSPRTFGLAQDLAVKLEDVYKINGRGDLVGSKQYYKDLANHLSEELEQNMGIGMNSNNKNFSAPVSSSRKHSIQFTHKPTSEEESIKQRFLQKLGSSAASEYDKFFQNSKKGKF